MWVGVCYPHHAVHSMACRFQTPVGSSQREGEEANHTSETQGGVSRCSCQGTQMLHRPPDYSGRIAGICLAIRSRPPTWSFRARRVQPRASQWLGKSGMRIEWHFAAGRLGRRSGCLPSGRSWPRLGMGISGIQPRRCHFCGQLSWACCSFLLNLQPCEPNSRASEVLGVSRTSVSPDGHVCVVATA